MGKNSIRSNLSKNDIIADIKLTLGADIERKKCIVVVEGQDDICFFNGKLEDETELQESYSGKKGVEEIIDFFKDKRVLGVCDSDYDTHDIKRNVVFYDNSCLEMMMVENDDVFSAVFYAYFEEKGNPIAMKLHIFESLKWISIFRRLNSQYGWGVKLRGISLSKAYDGQKRELVLEKIREEIKKENPGMLENIDMYFEQVLNECQTKYNMDEYLRITQGHDFLNFFQAVCKSCQKRSKRISSSDEIFRSLVCAYSKENLKKTKLAQSLISYQEENGLKIISA